MIERTQRQKTVFRLLRPASQQLKDELAGIAISETAQPIVDRWFAQWDADPRLLVSRGTSQEMGGHGPSHQIVLEKNGALEAILIDGQKRITTNSVYRRLILETIETYPADGPMKKARLPPSMHKPKPTFEHGGVRAGAKLFQGSKARPAAPAHVQERAASSSPTNEAKRGRGRPRRQVEQPAISSPAE